MHVTVNVYSNVADTVNPSMHVTVNVYSNVADTVYVRMSTFVDFRRRRVRQRSTRRQMRTFFSDMEHEFQ